MTHVSVMILRVYWVASGYDILARGSLCGTAVSPPSQIVARCQVQCFRAAAAASVPKVPVAFRLLPGFL